MSSSLISGKKRTSLFDYQRCNECDSSWVKEFCNKCGEGVCLQDICCETFPHYNNKLYIVCKSCINEIDNKLYILEEIEERKRVNDLKIVIKNK